MQLPRAHAIAHANLKIDACKKNRSGRACLLENRSWLSFFQASSMKSVADKPRLAKSHLTSHQSSPLWVHRPRQRALLLETALNSFPSTTCEIARQRRALHQARYRPPSRY